MPKRRVRTAKQIAAQRKAARASADKRKRAAAIKAHKAKKAANAAASYSHPVNKRARLAKAYYAGELTSTPPGFGGRRTKQGGKAYVAKSQSNFKMAPEAAAILAGKAGFRDQATSEHESRLAMGQIKPKVPKPKPKKVKGAYSYGR